MNRRFLTLLALALLLLMVGSFAWVADRSIRWVSSLPDRIEMSFDGDDLTALFTEGIRASLTQPDADIQTQMLHSLLQGAEGNSELATWLQTEFESELESLANSTDVGVASLASMIMSSH